ncbi:MAG: NAD-dependent epimerase/dehydratase family protein [Deltaproteobacteria bacterium]|nr:NAD-dependent epimerase/dehydratase family protein [Deltaproteobacteria bacterium]
MAVVLITGGGGFLGMALARVLAREHRVILLDSLVHGEHQRQVLRRSGLALVEADLRDRDALDQALVGVDWIVHLASLAGVEQVRAKPVETMETILSGTSVLLDACRDRRLERFVFVSTSEVYGSQARDAKEEAISADFDPTEARWSYGAAKLAAEHLVMAHAKQHGLPACVVRPFNVYGPGQFGQGAVHAMLRQALRGEPVLVHNQGDQIRAWLYVEDFVAGLLKTLESDQALGGVFNLGNPAATLTVLDLAHKVAALVGGVEVKHRALSGAEVDVRVPNIDRARRLLGFEARVGLDEGLPLTLGWLSGQINEGINEGQERSHA